MHADLHSVVWFLKMADIVLQAMLQSHALPRARARALTLCFARAYVTDSLRGMVCLYIDVVLERVLMTRHLPEHDRTHASRTRTHARGQTGQKHPVVYIRISLANTYGLFRRSLYSRGQPDVVEAARFRCPGHPSSLSSSPCPTWWWWWWWGERAGEEAGDEPM